jgi:hypothetical protein
MAAGDWQIQRVFANPVTGRVVVYYGQTGTYSNLLNALQYLATDPFEEGEFTAKSLVFVGYLVLKGQTNNLTDTTNNRIINAGIFRNIAGGSSGGSAVAQTLNDLSDVLITTPSNGQALIYDSGNWINGIPTSASFASTASYVQNAQTASYVQNAVSASFASTASYVLNAVSASFASTASSADNFLVRGTLTAQTIIAQTITSSTDFVTGSTRFGSSLSNTHQFTGSVSMTGSLNVVGAGITGSLFGTSSWANNATTASYVLQAVSASFATTSVSASFATNAANATTASYVLQAVSASFATNAANATTASYVLNAVSASFASTASYVLNAVSASFASTASYVLNAVSASFATNATTASYALNATSASFASTASSADNFTVRGTLTAQTIVAQTITSSTDFVTGSTRFGSLLSNTHQFTGSVSITGSLTLPYLSTGSVLFAGATDNITEDNTKFFWDNINKRLGIGTNAPSQTLHVVGTAYITENLRFDGQLRDNRDNGIIQQSLSSVISNRILTIGNATYLNINFPNGNILVGTTTDLGPRFQVSGSGYFSDSVGIGSTSLTANNLRVSKNITGGTIANNVFSDGTIQSDVTSQAFYFRSLLRTQAASFTVADVYHYFANGSTLGTNSAVTNQYGFLAEAGLTQGTNNFGFYGNIPSGTGRWNLYMNGTANNYLAGNLSIGTLATGNALTVSGASVLSGSLTVVTGSGIEFQVTDTGVKIGNAITDVHTVTGSLSISGSVTATNFTGSLFGTASWAQNAVTSSYILNAVSASFASTASSADNFLVRGTLTAQTIVAQTITSSTDFVTGSTRFGSLLSDTHQFTGSVSITGSLNVVGAGITGSFSGSITNAVSASYAATASYATNFIIASSLVLDQTLTDYASVGASSVGSNNLFSQNTSSYTSAFFKYTCASASNARSGEVVAVWNGATAQFYDNSTVDIGNTTAITSSVVIVTGQVQFNMQTNTSGWAIKSIATFM